MAGVAVDGSPWITGLQAGGLVFATLGCTIFGASLAARAISRRTMESGGNEFLAPAKRQRFNPEEHAASQQQEPAEWKDEPEPLYERQPSEDRD